MTDLSGADAPIAPTGALPEDASTAHEACATSFAHVSHDLGCACTEVSWCPTASNWCVAGVQSASSQTDNSVLARVCSAIYLWPFGKEPGWDTAKARGDFEQCHSGRVIGIDTADAAPNSSEVPLVDTTAATGAEGIAPSATPVATQAPAGQTMMCCSSPWCYQDGSLVDRVPHGLMSRPHDASQGSY